MAQSKRTCESAYKDGFMAACAETDVGWLRKTDAERILSVRSQRHDYVNEISQGDTDTESLTKVFFPACQDYFKISKGLRGRLMSMPSYKMMSHEELEYQLATYTPLNKIAKKKRIKRKPAAELEPIPLSEYELDREQRVKRNHILMGDLGIPVMVQQQHPVKPKATQNRRGQNVTAESDHALRRR